MITTFLHVNQIIYKMTAAGLQRDHVTKE